MSRNLYTFAVIAPELEVRCRPLLFPAPEPGAIELVENAIASAVAEPRPLVAFFRTILDGWSAAHRDLLARWRDMPDEVARGFGRLDQDGWMLIGAAEWPVGKALPDVDPSSLGAYAQRAFLAALQDAMVFAAATQCPLLILWRVVGPSFDDSAYRVTR